MYDDTHPAYQSLAKIGQEIVHKVRPKALIFFSAHWQSEAGPNTIEVNVSEDEPLIYDFGGFPKHYYAEKFHHRGSMELSGKVVKTLRESGIKVVERERGLDHGVWVVGKVMFEKHGLDDDNRNLTQREKAKKNSLLVGEDGEVVPIVQVSLFEDDKDAAAHVRLGKAVEKLREDGVAVICSGMAVHNLRDYFMMQGMPGDRPYTKPFEEAVKVAVETADLKIREQSTVDLLKRTDARKAHPTFEHLLPMHIGVGAAGVDQGKQLFTMAEGSVSWAQYRFGDVGVVA